MSLSWAELGRFVRERAKFRCETCQMHSHFQGATFHIDHVIPTLNGGTDDIGNLALACPSCNLSKSSRTTFMDPESGADAPIFNPRSDRWTDHFRFDNFLLIGLTSTGRATIVALNLNSPHRITIRTAEQKLGVHPPRPKSPDSNDENLSE